MKVSSEFISQSIIRLEENTPRIKKCLDQLTEEQIWQKPNPIATGTSTNSIANLILHLNGNITQYIISSIGNQPDQRKRDEEFSVASGMNKAELLKKLESTISTAVTIIQNVGEEELLRSRSVQGFELTGIGIIIHVVEHSSYHTGQIALQTKLVTDKDLGFYTDLDLNEKNN